MECAFKNTKQFEIKSTVTESSVFHVLHHHQLVLRVPDAVLQSTEHQRRRGYPIRRPAFHYSVHDI